jgi:hypothetical protein
MQNANNVGVTYKERYAYCVENEDEREFEEICSMRREAGHPVRTENAGTPINTCVVGRVNPRATHMVPTTRVGIMRSGTTSKTRRTNNQAVGLSQRAHKKDV